MPGGKNGKRHPGAVQLNSASLLLRMKLENLKTTRAKRHNTQKSNKSYREMAQWRRALATNPNDPSWIPGTHMVE